MAQKSGADAVSRALEMICGTIKRYRTKLDAVIDAAETAGAITAPQAATAHTFVEVASATCAIFQAIAAFNSITP